MPKTLFSTTQEALVVGLTVVAILAAVVGVWTRATSLHRKLLPFSGGVLLGIASFWIAPELAEAFGGSLGVAMLAGGLAIVWWIDRFIYPLCPTCSPAHGHDHCQRQLHGFATPLVAAAALHSFFDGWGVMLSQQSGLQGVAAGLVAGIAVHKLPEGFSLGVILRAALRTRGQAVLWAIVAEVPMLFGGWAVMWAGPHLPVRLLLGFLALAGASFLYLGYHAVHGDWKAYGARTVMPPAVAGLVAAGLVAFLVHH